MIFLLFASALVLGLQFLPLLIRWAARQQVFDPKDARKQHSEQVSSLGGIAIFGSFCALSLMVPALWYGQGMWLYLLLGVLFGVSLYDDLKPLSAAIRLLMQIVLAVALYGAGWAFPGPWGAPLTILFVLLMINGFNFIDGINGLAGSLGLVGILGFLVVFLVLGAEGEAWQCAIIAGSLLAFLRFNFGTRARIFMGDNGSTVLGLFLAACVLRYSSLTASTTTPAVMHWWVAALVALPIVDLLRVVVLRLIQAKSPFHADRQHLHHLYVDRGLSPITTCLSLVSILTLYLLALGTFTDTMSRILLTFLGLLCCYALPYLSTTIAPVRAEAAQKTSWSAE